jgi:hypothetical protein
MTQLTDMLTQRINGLGASGASAARRRRPRRNAGASRGGLALGDQRKARLQFATWVKQRDPALYARAIEAAKSASPEAVSGLGLASDFWTKFTDGLTQLATASIALKSQKAILDTNIARAQQGLPPIDMSAGAPVIRTQIGVDPATAARLQEGATAGVMRLLPWAIGAVAGFMLLKGKR